MTNDELRCSLEAVRNGDKTEFAQIYHDMKTPVYTLVLRIVKNRQTAEDILQELFVRLYMSPPEPSVLNPRAWIFRMARNLAIDGLRRTREHSALEDVQDLSDSRGEPETKLDIRRALDKLELAKREIVLLHLTAGLSFKEIAEITGLSAASVYRRYRAALSSLRSMLNGGDI
ncbi:MAG: RNA polymerase sigma factor [Oscillospiraceae bacterium]